MAIYQHSSLAYAVKVFMLVFIAILNLFLFNDGSGALVAKNIVINLWTLGTYLFIGLLILNAEIFISLKFYFFSSTVLLIWLLFNFLDETHIDEIINLLFLILGPLVIV